MNVKKLSSQAYKTIRSGIAASLLPVFLIYIFLDKPDYKIMNGVSNFVLPVAHAIGDFVSWPMRATVRLGENIHEISIARKENKILRAKLAEISAHQNECNVLIAENQKLEQQLDIIKQTPTKSVSAEIIHNNTAFHHSGFLINKGKSKGLGEKMVVISYDGSLAGIIDNVTDDFASVRSLSDSKSNIPVRVAGTSVYGFLNGAGGNKATFKFFSDPEFVPTVGIKLVSSGINGTLPEGIPIGVVERAENKYAEVKLFAPAKKLSEAIVLIFNSKEKYK